MTQIAEYAVSAVFDALNTRVEQPNVGDEADLRSATAQALLRGEPAEALAALAHVRLAPTYVLMMLGNTRASVADRMDLLALQAYLGPEYRRDLLAATSSGDDRLVVLFPSVIGIQRSEVRTLAERVRRGLAEAGRDQVIAAAPAPDREQISIVMDEVKIIMRVAQLLEYPVGIYQLDDVPIETSLMRSPDLANLLAQRLEPLRASGAPLLGTLQLYLVNRQDRRQTARALYIHPNTLDYRLRRIMELTGLAPTVPRDIQTLGAALMAWRLLGMNI